MAVLGLEHIGIIVEDMPAAVEFFRTVGLELEGETEVEGELVDRIVALAGARSQVVMLRTPDGTGCIELAKFLSPTHDGAVNKQEPSNAPGIRHILFRVDDVKSTLSNLSELGYGLVGELVNYEDMYWLCYVRGPEGIIVELAEKIA